MISKSAISLDLLRRPLICSFVTCEDNIVTLVTNGTYPGEETFTTYLPGLSEILKFPFEDLYIVPFMEIVAVGGVIFPTRYPSIMVNGIWSVTLLPFTVTDPV